MDNPPKTIHRGAVGEKRARLSQAAILLSHAKRFRISKLFAPADSTESPASIEKFHEKPQDPAKRVPSEDEIFQ